MPGARNIALVAVALAAVSPSRGYGGEAPPDRHPLHLSHARIVLEGKYIILNIRMFTDDLENALGRFHHIDGIRMRPEPIVDSLFSDYFDTKFILVVQDSAVSGAIAESGQAEDMWWYNIVFEAPAAVTEISFRNDILFDLFNDQRNITRVLHVPTERQQTYYSVASHPETHRFDSR
jgi:hypothetical protein